MEGSANERLDFGKMGYGCKHYRRRCKIRAPCCNEVFDCRHCHNESTHSWAMCSNYEISAKSNYNFEKPFLQLARKLAGHEAELAAAASQPLLDDDDDAFD